MIATYQNDVSQLQKYCLKTGADVNIPDNNNITPLQQAHEKDFKEIKHILLKAGVGV